MVAGLHARERRKTRIPSYVAFTDTGRLFGAKAKEQALSNPTNTIYDVMRFIDQSAENLGFQNDRKTWPFHVIHEENKPKVEIQQRGETKRLVAEEICAMILGHLKEMAEKFIGGDVKNAVVTLPFAFTFSRRQAIIDAGKIAGLNVMRILNSSTAAAVAFAFQNRASEERNLLVLDIGGSTTSISVGTFEDGILEMKSTHGDLYLGGEHFTNRVFNELSQAFKRMHNKEISSDTRAKQLLRSACEAAKFTLSTSSEASIKIESFFEGIDFNTTVTRNRFEEMCADLFRNTMDPTERAIREAKLDKSQIQDVVLVGGSTRIPKIQKLLSSLFFNGIEFKHTQNPYEAVVYGATVQAAIMDKDKALDDFILMEVVPHSLGFETDGGVMHAMLKRHTTFPTTKSHTVQFRYGGPIVIKVYEGERAMTKDNSYLAEVKVEDDVKPHEVKSVEGYSTREIQVTFDMDVNSQSAKNVTTQAEAEFSVNHAMKRLSTEDIENMGNEAKRFKLDDMEQDRLNFKNSLVAYANTVKLNLTDRRISAITMEVKQRILTKCEETIRWVESNRNADMAALQFLRNEIEALCVAITSQLQEAVKCLLEPSILPHRQ